MKANQMAFGPNKENYPEGTIIMGCCPHTMQTTLQILTGGEWLCLHRDSRQQELAELKEFHLQHPNQIKLPNEG